MTIRRVSAIPHAAPRSVARGFCVPGRPGSAPPPRAGKATLGIALALGLGLLAGCESSEQKAETRYQAGLALLEKGDVDRALVEFRNVFQLAPTHEAARLTYARTVRGEGDLREAYGQYLRLVEQHPENAEGRIALAEMALETGNWDEAVRHGTAAQGLLAGDPKVQAIAATLAYRDALQRRDEAARAAAVARARAIVAAHPEQIIARRIVLDSLVRISDWEGTLAQLDAGLAEAPEQRDLHQMRAAALYQLGRAEELEAELKTMIALSPQDEGIQNSLIGWYLGQKRPEAAEAFLRGRIEPAAPEPAARLKLVAFLAQTQGREAARAELDRIIAGAPSRVAVYRAMRARMEFEAGAHDEAIAEMRAIIESLPAGEEANGIKITLAQMLATTGNDVGARAEVEQVLAADAGHVDALKLKANWLIDDDRTGDALVALRAALDRAPRDAQVMTLMARAYERDGSRDLMGEMLSLAVSASGRAPAESLRYATFLEQDAKHLGAEDALVGALRLQPQNPDLLIALGRVYVAMKDWPRTDHVVRTLQGLGTDAAATAANEITARRLQAMNQDEELASFLAGLAAQGNAAPGVDVALIRTNLLRGDVEGALAQAETLLAKDPANPAARFLRASVLVSAGRAAEGEAGIRALLADQPQFEPAWTGLYNLLASRGDGPGATEILDRALAALPASGTLKWIKAGEQERAGDIDGAIGIYEALYEQDSNSAVIANNLASLLANHRGDPESLERAYTVARRLRGSQVPAFQDTYGWIAYRRGGYEEARTYLEPAAAGLPQDPTVGYHLAMTHGALGRTEEALDRLRRLEAAGAAIAPPPAWLAPVKEGIARFAAPAPAGAGGGQTGN